MAKLIDVANAMFKDRNKWKDITEEDKEEFFFICNRYFSKKYPEKAKLLNDKLINKVSAMDTWYIFMLNIPYPKWFWSKSTSSKSNPDFTEDEINILSQELDLKVDDIEILIKYYPKLVEEELKYYKECKK